MEKIEEDIKREYEKHERDMEETRKINAMLIRKELEEFNNEKKKLIEEIDELEKYKNKISHLFETVIEQ